MSTKSELTPHPGRRRAMLAVLGLVLMLAWPVSPAAHAVPVAPGIDEFVETYLDTHHLPGAAVALVRNGELVHEAGYGRSATGEHLSESSLLRIESASKPFTAFAVLQLVDDGRVDLDRAVVDYLPEFGVQGAGGDDITVRQLLSHTSGLATPTIIPPADTLAEGVARTQQWSLTAVPGTTYRYSNANYWIAARLVEVISEQPFNDYLTEHIFAPAGMADTANLTTTDTPVAGLPPGHVMSYGIAMPASELTAMVSGAGGMVSTAHDMAQWLMVQQNDGRAPDGTRLLSDDLVQESHHTQPHAGRSGLGRARSSNDDTPRIQHSGVGTTHNAQVTLDPETGNGVVVLLNSFTPTHEDAYDIASGVLNIAAGDDAQTGRPYAIWLDYGFAALTLLTLVGGSFGVRRASGWTGRRRHWGGVRFGLRLLPQLVIPAATVFLFFITPALQNNSMTTANVFWLYPAFMVLLLALAVEGVVVTGTRLWTRLRKDRS